MRIRKRYIWIAALCIYFIAVAYLCFMKTDEIPTLRPFLWGIPTDKLAHFLMFFPYPVLFYAAFQPFGRKKMFHFLVIMSALATGAGIALITEHIQGLLEYRSYDMIDFQADFLGMACSAFFVFLYILIRRVDIKNE